MVRQAVDDVPEIPQMQIGYRPQPEKKITLSGLLNAIDGACAQEGRLLIMTTNAPRLLDSALYRPGRVDKVVYLGYSTAETAALCFQRVFKRDPCKVYDEKAIDQCAKAFKDNFPEETDMTPAELSLYCMNYRGEPVNAVRDFDDYLEARRAGETRFKYDIGDQKDTSPGEKADIPRGYNSELLRVTPDKRLLQEQQGSQKKPTMSLPGPKKSWSEYLHFRAWRGKSVSHRVWGSEEPAPSDMISTPDTDGDDSSLWRSFPFLSQAMLSKSESDLSGVDSASNAAFSIDDAENEKGTWISNCLPFFSSIASKPQGIQRKEPSFRETMVYPASKQVMSMVSSTEKGTDDSSNQVTGGPLETLHVLHEESMSSNGHTDDRRTIKAQKYLKLCEPMPLYESDTEETEESSLASISADRIIIDGLKLTVGEKGETGGNQFPELKDLTFDTKLRSEGSTISLSQADSPGDDDCETVELSTEDGKVQDSEKQSCQIPGTENDTDGYDTDEKYVVIDAEDHEEYEINEKSVDTDGEDHEDYDVTKKYIGGHEEVEKQEEELTEEDEEDDVFVDASEYQEE